MNFDPNYLGSGILINLAIEKYGTSAFKKIVVCDCDTKEELNEKEKYWIKELNTQNRKIGYNIAEGGDGGDTLSKNPNLDLIKEKLSKAAKGKTYEERYGKDKAKSLKNHFREKAIQGKSFNHHGKTYEEAFGEDKAIKLKQIVSTRFKGKTYEELYGEEKAKELKRTRSKASIKKYRIYGKEYNGYEEIREEFGLTNSQIHGRLSSLDGWERLT